jgi:drug/metabolite transporter (DMT)-like permease
MAGAAGMTGTLAAPKPEGGGLVCASLMVALASVAFGLIPLFARNLTEAGIAPSAVSMYRYLLPGLVFLPFLRLRGPLATYTAMGYCSGVLVSLGWVGYVRALTIMPVPVAGVLYMTYPLFVLVVGWLLFGDRPKPRAWIGGAMILLAALVVAQTAGKGATGFGPGAVLLALAAPAGFGLGINVLTHMLVHLPLPSRIAAFSLGSVTGLTPLVARLPAGQALPSNLQEIALILGLSLVTALLPQLLYTHFVPRIGAAKSGAIGSLELPTMFAVGWIVMGDAVGPREALAGLLVLVAILLTPAAGADAAKESRNE